MKKEDLYAGHFATNYWNGLSTGNKMCQWTNLLVNTIKQLYLYFKKFFEKNALNSFFWCKSLSLIVCQWDFLYTGLPIKKRTLNTTLNIWKYGLLMWCSNNSGKKERSLSCKETKIKGKKDTYSKNSFQLSLDFVPFGYIYYLYLYEFGLKYKQV